MSRLPAALVLALILILPVRGAGSSISAQDDERLRVIATFSIIGDIVQNVAGDAVDLSIIVGPDGDPHTFEPSPEQIADLADADLIFENGIEFETWLDDMYEASGSGATRVPLADGLDLLEISGEAHDDETADHDHGDHDPHVWQDVGNVIAEVSVIRDSLTAADPANTATYTANAEAYAGQLQELDSSIRTMVETVPAENRVLFTSHDALGYFAHAYGFTIAGTALGSVSTEASDPSAGEIVDLIDQIKAAGATAIFVENVESGDLMSQIARDAGVILAPTLYTDALGTSESPAATYIAMMTYNAVTIVTALGGQVVTGHSRLKPGADRERLSTAIAGGQAGSACLVSERRSVSAPGFNRGRHQARPDRPIRTLVRGQVG